MLENDTKQCPFCAELVKKEATICRFCQMDFSTGRPAGSQNVTTSAPREVQARSGVADGVKLGCGMFVVLPILIIGGIFFALIFFGVVGNVASRKTEQSTNEAMIANEALTTAHNIGWHWAQDNNAKTVEACEALSNADERYGCVKYVENMLP